MAEATGGEIGRQRNTGAAQGVDGPGALAPKKPVTWWHALTGYIDECGVTQEAIVGCDHEPVRREQPSFGQREDALRRGLPAKVVEEGGALAMHHRLGFR